MDLSVEEKNRAYHANRVKQYDEKHKKRLSTTLTEEDVKSWFQETSDTIQRMQEYHKDNEGRYKKNYGGLDGLMVKAALDTSKDVYSYLQLNKDKIKNYDQTIKLFSDLKSALEQNDSANYQKRRYYGQFESAEEYNTAKQNQATLQKQQSIEGMSLEEIEKHLGKGTKEDHAILFELSRTNVPYDRETAIANGIDEHTYNDIEQKRQYISEKFGVDLYEDIYNNVHIFNDLMNSIENPEIAYTTLDGKNVTWQSLYDSKKKEANLASIMADAKSDPNYHSFVEQGNGMDGEVKWGGLVKIGENKIATYRGPKGMLLSAQNFATSGGGPENEMHMLSTFMTEDEADLYSYLLVKDGVEAADAYYENLKSILLERKSQKAAENSAKIAEKAPVLSSVLSVMATPMAAAQYAIDFFDTAATGEVKKNDIAIAQSTIRSTVSNKVDWEIGNWDAFDFIYNTGMSAADSAIAMATFGKAGGVVLGLSAAAQATNDAIERGVSKDKAFWTGAAAGTFEGLFESFSIGKFNALKEVPVSSVKDVARNIASQMLVNASEETFTEVANVLTDAFLNTDFSQAETTVRQYMAQGMSEEEAREKVGWEVVGQIAEAAGSGALMGAGFGVVGSAPNYLQYRNAQNQYLTEQGQKIIDGGEADALEQLALEMAGASKGRTARSLSSQANKVAKNPTARSVGKLAASTNLAAQRQTRADLQSELIKQDLTRKEASIAVKDMLGEELTSKEEEALAKSSKIQEAITAVQESGEIASSGLGGAYYGNLVEDAEKVSPESIIRSAAPVAVGDKKGTNDRITNTESEEITYEGTNSLHLRNGSERLGGADSTGQVSRLEKGARSNKIWAKGETSADSGAVGLVNEGREVTVASLGVRNGSTTHTVKLLDGSKESASMKSARKRAAARGLNVKFFAGDNLVSYDKDGKEINSRAYIVGNQVLVRADHPKYTADQLIRHEIGHDMIAKGEVDIEKVRQRLKQKVGEENIDAIAEIYGIAYEGTGMSADEIWEECICDSLGDMNIFAKNASIADFTSMILPEIKAETKSQASPTQTRGSPEGKDTTWMQGDSEAKFSIETEPGSGESFVIIETESIKNLMSYPGNSIAAKVRSFIKQYRGTVLPLGSTDKAFMRREAEGEYTNPAKAVDLDVYNSKLNAASELKNLLKASTFIRHDVDNGRHPDAIRGWNYYKISYVVPISDTEIRAYTGEIQIKLISRGDCFYDITKIKDITNGTAGQALIKAAGSVYNVSTHSISQNSDLSTDNAKKVSEGKTSREVGHASIEVNSDGETLSKEQADFFKNSKVRDENGNLMVMYHGTPNGIYTVFRSGSYFTKDSAYADKYQNPGASSLSVKRTADAPKTYKVYLNITKPFDTRKTTERRIFQEEFFRKYGTGTPLAESGLPDWIDGMDLQEFIEEMDYDYDGLILDEGGTGGYGDDVVSRGLSYVAFSPEQVKNVDNKTPTNDPDVRFSRELDSVDYIDEQAERDGLSKAVAQPLSTRSLLANALESVAQNDIERKKLNEYKSKIALMEAEQAKLAELRGKIKELSFAKGKKDNEAIKKLQFEANQIANRIKTYDKQLLNLESTKALKGVLEREKQNVYKRAAQKGREAMHRSVEGRHKTEMRNKIKRIAKELDALLNRGTKDRNVKKGASTLVRRVLDLSDMLFATDDELLFSGIGTEYTKAEEAAMDRYFELYEEYHSFDDSVTENKEKRKAIRSEMNEVKKGFEGVLERERQRISKEKASGLYDALIEEYRRLKTAKESYIRDAFSQDALDLIESIKESDKDTLIKDMTLEQLENVYKTFRIIQTAVSDSNKLFKGEGKATVEQEGSATLREIEAHGKKRQFSKLGLAYSTASWNNQKAIYLIERTGSKTLQKLFQRVLDAESEWARLSREAKIFADEQKKKFGYDKWDLEKKWEFQTGTGLSYQLNLGQLFTLYAYSKRGDQALDHLKTDGFVFDQVEFKKKGKTYVLNDKTAYKITDEVLQEIIGDPTTGKAGILSKEQKAYIDAMQAYLSDVLGARGNEISEKLIGIDLFNEANYLPIHSEGAYLAKLEAQNQGTPRIKSRGFTKPTKEGARNAIVLSDFGKLWSEHTVEMNEYVAFTLPLEDFYKVYNYQLPSATDTNKGSVKAALEDAYGPAATKAIEALLDDLNGSARSDSREGFFKHTLGAFKKAKVMASLSVVIQQPSSILRAQAMIDPKYFVGKKLDKAKHKALWEELKEYAPVAIIKEMGYFDVGMGQQTAKWIMGDTTARDKIDELTSRPAAYADEVAWIGIWNAVKRETAHNNPKMSTSSKEFLLLAGKRFEDVIRHTQVYDSTLSRSANMRSKSAFMQMVTSFMAEPTTSLNMREAALRSGDKKRIWRTTYAVYTSFIVNALLVALPYAMRDDDEDETFIEKYLSAATSSFLANLNPLAAIPFVKDVWSLAQGYDVGRSDVGLVDDAFISLRKIFTEANKEEVDQEALTKSIVALVGDVANCTGIPLKNLVREVDALINTVRTVTRDIGGRETTLDSLSDALKESVKSETPVWGWFPDETKGDKLYDAILGGDEEYAKRIEESYDSASKYQSALRKALRENDPRIQEAALADLDGDVEEYGEIIQEIVDEGNFDKDDVVAAVAAERNKLDPDKAASEGADEKEAGIYDAEHYLTAARSGDASVSEGVKKEIINTAIANGKTEEEAEKAFYQGFTSCLRKAYGEGDVSREEASDLLLKYGNKDANEAYWALKQFDYYKENGTTEGYSMYSSFHEAVQSGKNLKAVIKEYLSHGVKKETLSSQITSHFKPLYREMTPSERAAIKGYLLNAYACLGYDRGDKVRDINKWLKD